MCAFDTSKVTKVYFNISVEVCTCAAMETDTILHCFNDLCVPITVILI